jgi:hypothetical protein
MMNFEHPDEKERLWEIFTSYALKRDTEDYVHMTKSEYRVFLRDLETIDRETDGIFREGTLSESQVDVVFRKSVKRCEECKGRAKMCFQDFLTSLVLVAEEKYDSEEEDARARLLREIFLKRKERAIQRAREIHKERIPEREAMSSLWSTFSKELKLIYDSYCDASNENGKMNVKQFLRCAIELGLSEHVKTIDLILLFLSLSPDRPLCDSKSYPHHIEFSNGFRDCVMALASRSSSSSSLSRSSPEERLNATLHTIWKHLGDSKRRLESCVKPFYDAYVNFRVCV